MAMKGAPEGEDIDTETLQSQIDMSMSLVHDLVSSWVKPSQNVRTNSTGKVQQELEEYMRRPPRLGVGAPIPETSNACRDTARLKNQLTNGKKRARYENDDVKQKQQGIFSDDEEESRAGVMKKKVKVDVFDGGKKKGKKRQGKEETNNETLVDTEDSQDHDVMSHGCSATEMVVDSNTPHTIDAPTAASLGTPFLPTHVRTFQTIPALMKQPLLNLDGPPLDVDDPGNDSIPSQGVSPKKKRKRHKKKKTSLPRIPMENGAAQISQDTDLPSIQ